MSKMGGFGKFYVQKSRKNPKKSWEFAERGPTLGNEIDGTVSPPETGFASGKFGVLREFVHSSIRKSGFHRGSLTFGFDRFMI